MGYRFKGLPTKQVEGYTLPDDSKYEKLGLDPRLATIEYPEDLGKMGDDDARLKAGQEVEVREIVPVGEIGAGPVNEENVVVEWNFVTNPDFDPNVEGSRETVGLRAMSFTKDQFNSLFEEVK